jgi:hypothetical protein
LRGATALIRLMFQNQACPQYYVHKRYSSVRRVERGAALPCQIWFHGIEL